MTATLKSLLKKVDSHLNPYTVAFAVFCIWSLSSRFGMIPGSSDTLITTNDDGDEVKSRRGQWNFGQSLIVAGIVLATYFLLRGKQAVAPILAGGITLPEGASILMPSDVSKSNFADVRNPGDISHGADFLSGPAPF